MKLVCIFITTRMLQTTNTTTNKLSGLHWIDISSKWQARFALHTKLDRGDKKNYITNDISGNWGAEGRGLRMWFCKVGGLVVLWYKAQLPAPPPPSTQSQMDITQWSVPGSKMKMCKDCDNLREKRAEALFPRRRRRRRRRPLCQITRVLLPGTGLA